MTCTMTFAVTSGARLHRFAEKRHSLAHSEVHNGPITKIICLFPAFIGFPYYIQFENSKQL